MASDNLPSSDRYPTVALIRMNTFWTTAMHLERALGKICNVVPVYLDESSLMYYLGTHWIPSALTTDLIDRIVRRVIKDALKANSLDLLLVVDPITFRIRQSSWQVPTAYYAIDSHMSFNVQLTRTDVSQYDYLFVAQKDSVSSYKKAGCKNVSWLPVAADLDIHRPLEKKRKFDVCFVGNLWPERREFIEKLESMTPNLRWYVGRQWLHNLALIYSSSNIILNKSLAGDLNMRVFEALACGRLLVTDEIKNGLADLFTNGQDLVTFSSLEEASDLIKYYAENSVKREEIAKNGRECVLRSHTYLHRARQILDTVGLGKLKEPA